MNLKSIISKKSVKKLCTGSKNSLISNIQIRMKFEFCIFNLGFKNISFEF